MGNYKAIPTLPCQCLSKHKKFSRKRMMQRDSGPQIGAARLHLLGTSGKAVTHTSK